MVFTIILVKEKQLRVKGKIKVAGSKSQYDGLQEVNEMRLIGLFFNNVDDTITDEQKKIEQLKRVKESLLYCMFPHERTNTYHYL